MLMTQRLIQCRSELKHLIRDHEVVHFLSGLGPVLSDPRFRRHQGRITTVYLDRPDGLLARNALNCPGRNLKVRLREYFSSEGIPCSPFIWIEIKERDGSTSRKSRFQLHKLLVTGFLKGDVGVPEVLRCQGPLANREGVIDAVRRVREVADGNELVPAGAVCYRRLALEGGAPLARMTLDQDVSYHLAPRSLYESHPALEPEALGPSALEEEAAIVEVKHRGSVAPAWCRRALDAIGPVEYSKFRVLAGIATEAQRRTLRETQRGNS